MAASCLTELQITTAGKAYSVVRHPPRRSTKKRQQLSMLHVGQRPMPSAEQGKEWQGCATSSPRANSADWEGSALDKSRQALERSAAGTTAEGTKLVPVVPNTGQSKAHSTALAQCRGHGRGAGVQSQEPGNRGVEKKEQGRVQIHTQTKMPRALQWPRPKRAQKTPATATAPPWQAVRLHAWHGGVNQ